MGIESLYGLYDKAKWAGEKAKWVGGKAKELYERDKKWRKKKGIAGLTTTPYLWNILDAAGFVGTDAPAFDVDKAGTGKKDSVLGVDVPNMWESYDTQKQFADYGVEMTPETHPTLDKLQRSANLISDTAKWPLNAIQSGLEFLPDIAHITATAGKEGWRGLENLIDPWTQKQSPQGTGAWWTQTADMLGNNPIAKAISFGSIIPTNMDKDAEGFVKSAYPPLDAEGYFDTDLSNWPEYQTFKSGMGWDNADDRRINNRVESTMKNKPIPPGEILKDFYKLARENMDTVIGQNGVTGAELVASPAAVEHYFKQYFDRVKEEGRNNLRNEYEFQKTGQKFADWLSTDYRNDLIGKYGMYPVFDEYGDDQLEILTQDISPFASAKSNLSLANKDYINAVKAGKEKIGEPLEWSYGAYDKSPGYGIPEEHKKWFEYGTKEAEKVFESNQAEGLELAALIAVNAPAGVRAPIQAWLQKSKVGRVLRESMPGLFQHGSRVNFGLPRIPLVNRPSNKWWKTYNALGHVINKPMTAINWVRPKGGQFLGALALGESGANWQRN